MKYTVTPVGFKELQRDLKKMSKEKAIKVKQETYASALKIRDQAIYNLKALEAWDTGNLANTTIVERIGDGSIVKVEATAPYAIYVEFGTKPHFPPYKGEDAEGLERWAKKHGFDSVWPLCLAIAEHGTPEQPFLFPAFLSIEGGYFNRVKGLLGK